MTQKLAPLVFLVLLLAACGQVTTTSPPGLDCSGFPKEALGVCTITQGLLKSQSPVLGGEFNTVRDWEAGTWYYVDETANAVLIYVNNDKKTPAWFGKAEVICQACSVPTPTPLPTSTPLPFGSDTVSEYQPEDMRGEILQAHNGWEQWAPVEYLQKLQRETGVEFRICVNEDGCGIWVELPRPIIHPTHKEWNRRWAEEVSFLQYVQVNPEVTKDNRYIKLLENPLYRWVDEITKDGAFIDLEEGWVEP